MVRAPQYPNPLPVSTILIMLTCRTSLLCAALLLGLSGCGAPNDPPAEGDHSAEKYQADLQACRSSSAESVRRRNAATPGTWIISPFTGPPEVRAAIRTCMAGKGYTLAQNPG